MTATDIVLNQLAPGGVMKQLGDAVGGVTYDQYAHGGPIKQLCDTAGIEVPTDQYAPGGPIRVIEEEIEGGGDVWPPANALIAIDFVHNRAYANGGAAAIDTLVGADPNTEGAWGTTEYDPELLTADGYTPETQALVAFIGAARTRILAGSTMVARFKGIAGGSAFVSPAMSADGTYEVQVQLNSANGLAEASAYTGTLAISIADIVNSGETAINVVALTTTSTRFEFAVNGSAPVSAVLTEAEYTDMVAALVQTAAEGSWQTFTIYEALPSTAGLSALSEIT